MPEKYFNQNYDQPVTEVAIRSTPVEDLYVILEGWDQSGSVAFKVLVNPLVSWIWIGGGVLVLGGLIAFWPDRRRKPAIDGSKERPEVEEGQAPEPEEKGGFCTECGAPYQKGDRFCARCGAKIRT